MNRYCFGCAALILSSTMLFALVNKTDAASVHSGGFRAWQSLPASPVYAPSFYRIPSFPTQVAPTAPAEEDYAYGALEGVGKDTVLITIRVPADAEIWFDGSKTAQTGRLRSFVSPPLQPRRNYSYEIRARWTEGGRTIEETRRINVQAGDRDNLNFVTP